MNFDLSSCKMCPRRCGADRYNTSGACGEGSEMRISKIMLHHWEEPCISGTDPVRGSGAIFFSGCPLKCVFCQNKAISAGGIGKNYLPKDLAEEIRRLEEAGAYNINFVSPTHFTAQIIEALNIYRPKIPVIFNTGGYELPETVESLRGYADIFLTDFKYGTDTAAKKYSKGQGYVECAKEALRVMVSITGKPQFTGEMLSRGTIVRHLILPGERRDSMKALDAVASTVKAEDVMLSLMSQYTPEFYNGEYKNLSRRLTTFEYESVRDYALSLGFTGYSQDVSSATAAYTPDFEKRKD